MIENLIVLKLMNKKGESLLHNLIKSRFYFASVYHKKGYLLLAQKISLSRPIQFGKTMNVCKTHNPCLLMRLLLHVIHLFRPKF